MFTIQFIRSKLYDWRRARAQVVDFRSSTTNVPFSLLQETLNLSSPKWNFFQKEEQSATGQYLPTNVWHGRIDHAETADIGGKYRILPMAFVRFIGDHRDPREFMRQMPLNCKFRIFILEMPNGDGAARFPTFEEMLPHARAGIRGQIDGRGILTVKNIILNGTDAPYSSLWPQRGVMRVINVMSRLVEQIQSGVPYDPVAAQRSAWHASARLPRPQPPYYRQVGTIQPADKPTNG